MTVHVSGLSAVRSGRTILHPTSLSLEPGERIALVGASGSGKSTLGHALVDQLREDGVSVAHVPQSPDEALDPLRTLAFHWREAEQALGLSPQTERRQALFDTLKIADGDLNKRPWGWSRGMRQRFVIAMALIGEPQVLVLDEPTSALDPIVAASTMALLDEVLAGQNTAVLLITHDIGLAGQRAARVLVMNEGHIVEDTPTQQLLDNPASPAAQRLASNRHWMAVPC